MFSKKIGLVLFAAGTILFIAEGAMTSDRPRRGDQSRDSDANTSNLESRLGRQTLLRDIGSTMRLVIHKDIPFSPGLQEYKKFIPRMGKEGFCALSLKSKIDEETFLTPDISPLVLKLKEQTAEFIREFVSNSSLSVRREKVEIEVITPGGAVIVLICKAPPTTYSYSLSSGYPYFYNHKYLKGDVSEVLSVGDVNDAFVDENGEPELEIVPKAPSKIK